MKSGGLGNCERTRSFIEDGYESWWRYGSYVGGIEVKRYCVALPTHHSLTLLYSVIGQVGDDENSETSASSRLCAGILVLFSVLLIILFFPFSMFYVVKVCVYLY